MQHLNPYRFYELAAKLHALFSCGAGDGAAARRVAAMFAPLTEAQAVLDSWIKGEAFALTASKAEAERLLARIAAIFNKYYIDPTTRHLKTPSIEESVSAHEMATLAGLLEKFEHALASELARAPVYAAEKRGIYATYELATCAEESFSETLRQTIPPAALTEFNAAGRALAFGLGTAATLHLLRATELTLRRYYEAFSGTAVARGERSYTIYLKKLSALAEEGEGEGEPSTGKPDKRLLQMLAQIKENYRQPLTAPDTVSSVDQAGALFALAMAAITLMAEQIAALPAVEAAAPAPEKKPAQTSKKAAAKAGADDDGDTYDFRAAQAG